MCMHNFLNVHNFRVFWYNLKKCSENIRNLSFYQFVKLYWIVLEQTDLLPYQISVSTIETQCTIIYVILYLLLVSFIIEMTLLFKCVGTSGRWVQLGFKRSRTHPRFFLLRLRIYTDSRRLARGEVWRKVASWSRRSKHFHTDPPHTSCGAVERVCSCCSEGTGRHWGGNYYWVLRAIAQACK